MVKTEEKNMPRKGENIYKRKDGRWEARYIYSFKEDGSPKYRSIYAADYLTVKKKQNDAKRKTHKNIGTLIALYTGVRLGELCAMEGSYDTSEQITAVKDKKKAVMYSGKLDEQYGIKMLVDAFMSIQDSDIELWITGGGNTEAYIKECAKKDNRIKFYGFLPSRQDVLQKQAEASLLVNMRLPSEPASGYCFPSKLFEYMATGTPVLSFDIAGIPREYLQHLYVVKQENANALAKSIEETLSLDEVDLQKQGNEAREFVINEKNTKTQCSKMWKFVTD